MNVPLLKDRCGDVTVRSIAVFRALQLGDMLCSVPAFRALRAALPSARVTLVGLPWAREFVERYRTYIDDFLEFPGYPGLPEIAPDIRRIPAFFAAAQARRFDLALQLHGSGSFVNSVTVLLGARMNAGFYLPGEFCPDPDRFMAYPGDVPEIRRYLTLLKFLGIPPKGDHLEFPLTDEDWRAYRRCAGASSLRPGAYACVHAGARLCSRRWLPERFAEVADHLAARGYAVVLTGSADEADIADRVRRAMRQPAVNLAGSTTVGATALLIGNAALLVANDTGVSHIAAAVRTPSVIVATGSDPARWAPLDCRLHRVVHVPVGCRPCNFAACPRGYACAVALESCRVIAEVENVLAAEVDRRRAAGRDRTGNCPAAPSRGRRYAGYR